MIIIISIIACIYGGLTLILFLFQEQLIYFPSRNITATPANIGLAYETVKIETQDGISLSGWFVPAQGADDVVLFFHGNAGNISHRLESVAQLNRLGLSVLIIDYRGYGQSEGRPDEQGTYYDAEAAWRYLLEERQIAPEQIIILGRSLGGGVGAWLATQHTPKALILESTFTSVPDMAAKQFPFLPVRPLARINYNTLARLEQIEAPLLIVHSPNDEVIPYQHGQLLFEQAKEPKQFLEISGGHNDGFMISARQYEAGLSNFLANLSQSKFED